MGLPKTRNLQHMVGRFQVMGRQYLRGPHRRPDRLVLTRSLYIRVPQVKMGRFQVMGRQYLQLGLQLNRSVLVDRLNIRRLQYKVDRF